MSGRCWGRLTHIGFHASSFPAAKVASQSGVGQYGSASWQIEVLSWLPSCQGSFLLKKGTAQVGAHL